jgi:hypothetical protein
MGTRTKRNKPKTLSDQLREIIEGGPMSRYELGKRAAVDASQLCKFVQGKARLTTESLDRVGEALRLRFVQDDD